MEIKIPKNITEMRIKHLAFISKLAELGEKEYSISEIRQMNAAFLQVPFDEFPNYRPKDDIRIFTTICKAISTKPKQANEETFIGPDGKEYIEPDQSVEYNGIIYTLRKDFTKLPTSWYMDIDIAFEMHGEGFERMPELMAAFCYVEKGLLYAQKDENKVVVNSVVDRSKVFAEFMPLDKFMNLQGFFFVEMARSSTIINGSKSKAKKNPKPKPKQKWQWEKAVDSLAERFRCSWDDVSSWNILTFMHKSEFYKNELQEKKAEQQRRNSKFKRR